MERLTDNYGGENFLICNWEDCYIPEEECIVCYACEVAEKAIKKLTEYEDTGLTPQEVKELADAKELIEKMASYIMNTDIDELICKHTKCQDSCIKCVVDFFKSKLKEGDTE